MNSMLYQALSSGCHILPCRKRNALDEFISASIHSHCQSTVSLIIVVLVVVVLGVVIVVVIVVIVVVVELIIPWVHSNVTKQMTLYRFTCHRW